MTDEFEFANEDDTVGQELKLADFGAAVLWGTDWTVETILAQLQRGNIDINPRFQRRDAWSKGTKSRFVESIILGLPIPQVVLAESKNQRGRYLILDGKQRLLSLMQFAGYAEGENNGFSLSSLEVRGDLARKRFRHLEREPNLQGELNAFLTHTIRAVVIRNWPSLTFLHVVFQRLNTGSLKLSAQELRQAVAPGSFTNFADDATIQPNALHRLLGRGTPDPRMRDVELLVRHLGFRFRLSEYSGRMKEFLDRVCVGFNDNWDQDRGRIENGAVDFLAAIQALESIFGEAGVARKRGSRLFNRSIFDALSYYAVQPEIRDRMLANGAAVREAYSAVMENEDFLNAIESDTAGIPHTADRLRIWGQRLSNALGFAIAIPELAENQNGELRFVA